MLEGHAELLEDGGGVRMVSQSLLLPITMPIRGLSIAPVPELPVVD